MNERNAVSCVTDDNFNITFQRTMNGLCQSRIGSLSLSNNINKNKRTNNNNENLEHFPSTQVLSRFVDLTCHGCCRALTIRSFFTLTQPWPIHHQNQIHRPSHLCHYHKSLLFSESRVCELLSSRHPQKHAHNQTNHLLSNN